MKLMGMTTRREYKITNDVCDKYKTWLCVVGNQQITGIHFNESDLYAPFLKAHEVRLVVATALQLGAKMYKYYTSGLLVLQCRPGSICACPRLMAQAVARGILPAACGE
jgi:hypothetical protein